MNNKVFLAEANAKAPILNDKFGGTDKDENFKKFFFSDVINQIYELTNSFSFRGIAKPSTNPGSIDVIKTCYIASEKGTYTHFPNIDQQNHPPIQITDDEIILLKYSKYEGDLGPVLVWKKERLCLLDSNGLIVGGVQFSDLISLLETVAYNFGVVKGVVNASPSMPNAIFYASGKWQLKVNHAIGSPPPQGAAVVIDLPAGIKAFNISANPPYEQNIYYILNADGTVQEDICENELEIITHPYKDITDWNTLKQGNSIYMDSTDSFDFATFSGKIKSSKLKSVHVFFNETPIAKINNLYYTGSIIFNKMKGNWMYLSNVKVHTSIGANLETIIPSIEIATF